VPDHESAASLQTQPRGDTEAQAHRGAADERFADDVMWAEDPEELPRRPRRRILSPAPLALLGVLLVAAGFIAGVLVEKGQGSSSSSGGSAGLASRLSALRGGTPGSGSGATPGVPSSNSGFSRPTVGTVAYLSGSTLYVTNSEGNTVKINTSAGTGVTKTVKSTVSAIHPGEPVTVTGVGGAGGAVSAESISVGSSGGGLASLFGAGGGPRSGARGTGGGSTPSLFGSG
jgi:hypothetical protein